jgi:hypothetical protein
VVPYIARLHEADVRIAVAAVARAFALPAAVTSCRVEASADVGGGHDLVDASAGAAAASDRAQAAVRRLIVTVPEMRSPALAREQRRLVILALAATRALAWARTSEFVAAMAALEAVEFEVDAVVTSASGVPRAERPSRPATNRAPIGRTATAPFDTLATPDASAGDTVVTRAGASSKAPRPEIAARRTRSRRSEGRWESPLRRRQPGSEPSAVALDAATSRDSGPDVPTPLIVEQQTWIDTEWWTPVAQPEDDRPSIAAAGPVETQYGGIFYLLNAWLAIGLYSDFTAPRGPNLALSPWDLLALDGAAWFGPPFLGDPIWRLLADLAARDPEAGPGRDVDLPDGWLEDHRQALGERLGSALACEQAEDVAAIVCCHQALIQVTASAVHVHLSLSALPLEVRIAGLDRDPGWIPAAGRSVYFHFA